MERINNSKQNISEQNILSKISSFAEKLASFPADASSFINSKVPEKIRNKVSEGIEKVSIAFTIAVPILYGLSREGSYIDNE